MIPAPAGVRLWLATGHTYMRRGFPVLALLGHETLKAGSHAGHLFVFRGKRGDLIKVIWHHGQRACLFSKRLEKGRFIWPGADHEDGCHRRFCDDLSGAARLSAGGDRLAGTASDVSATDRQLNDEPTVIDVDRLVRGSREAV